MSFATLLLLPGALNAQTVPADEELMMLIRDRVRRAGVGGMVVGVLEADGTTRIVAYGDAGRGPMELNGKSLFEIGSITKVFTGILLAQMVSGGEVALSDAVVKYLPDGTSMPSHVGRQITLLDLATHHSGLPALPPDWPPHSSVSPRPEYTPAQLYAFLSEYRLPRDAGSKFAYSNIGVGLLGHVLERVGGKSYENLLRERVLDPLGMALTSTRRDGERRQWMTQAHNRDGSVAPYRDFHFFPAMGGLKSNVEELLLLIAAGVRPPQSPIQRAIRDSYQVREQYSAERGIGLNWFVWSAGDARIVGHGGSTLGFEAFLGFDPESGIGAVVLANVQQPVADIGMHIINRDWPVKRVRRPAPLALIAWIAVAAAGVGVAARRIRGAGRSRRGA